MHDPYFCMIVNIKNNQNCKLSQRNFRPQLNSALKIRRQLIFSQNLVTDQPTKKWRLFDVNLTGCAHWGTPCAHIRQNVVKLTLHSGVNKWSKQSWKCKTFFRIFLTLKGESLTLKISWKVVKLTFNTDVKKQLKSRQIDLEYWRQKTVEKSSNWPWILTSKNSWKGLKFWLIFSVKRMLPCGFDLHTLPTPGLLFFDFIHCATKTF